MTLLKGNSKHYTATASKKKLCHLLPARFFLGLIRVMVRLLPSNYRLDALAMRRTRESLEGIRLEA
jgi:hypothetical protein